MNSNANQELKNSMFQDVFGYESNTKNLTGMPPSKPAPNSTLPVDFGKFSIEDKSDLPPVILEQIPLAMRANESQESARVVMETRVIQNLIYSYFNIVKKNISDLVPKTIMAFLVNESRKIAQSELVAQIYKTDNLESLLVEDPMVVEQRNRCQKTIAALKEAQLILVEVSKFDL